MTFKKFTFQVLLPVSIILAAIFFPVGVMLNPEIAELPGSFVISSNETLTSKLPQSTFDYGEDFFKKFYANSEGVSQRNVTSQVYVSGIIFYSVIIFIIMFIVYYIYYRIKKIKKA